MRLEYLEDRRLLNAGAPDLGFGSSGKVSTAFPGTLSSQAQATLIQSDGKIVAVGSASIATGREFALSRYNPDGSLDLTFGTKGQVLTSLGQSAVAAGAVLQTDGKIVVAGSNVVARTSQFALARYNPDGSLDPTFGTGGLVTKSIGTNATSTAVAMQADGKIVVVGSIVGATSDFAVARYNPDGSPDTTFGPGGQVTTDFSGNQDVANAVVIQADGRIVVVGSSLNPNANQDFALARYNPDGTLDPSFGGTGQVTTDLTSQEGAAGVALQTDGKLLIVGSTTSSGNQDFALLRYNVDGTLDSTFGTSGSVKTDFAGRQDAASAVVLQNDGKMVVAGSSGITSPSGDFALARYNPDGSLDGSFGSGGLVLTDFFGQADDASALALQTNGRIVVAGAASNGGTPNFALARYMGDLSILVDVTATTSQALEAGFVPGAFTITRSGDTITPVTIRYTVSGTAQAGIDYGSLNGVIALPTGVTTATIPVTPLDGSPETCNDTIVVSLNADPTYTLGASVTGTITLIRDPLKIFVVALYRDVLGRLPDAVGQSFWVRQLTAGASRQQIASNFWLSPEHRGMLVDQFYTTFLHRPADAAGRASWISYLLAGGNEADVVIAFVTSPEYTAAHPSNASFVQGLYSDVLQRGGSDAEVAFWEQILQGGAGNRMALARVFLGSEEAYREAIDEYYEEFLGRAPDPIGQQSLLAQMLAGQTTPPLLIAGFLGSEEYFARVQMLACS